MNAGCKQTKANLLILTNALGNQFIDIDDFSPFPPSTKVQKRKFSCNLQGHLGAEMEMAEVLFNLY